MRAPLLAIDAPHVGGRYGLPQLRLEFVILLPRFDGEHSLCRRKAFVLQCIWTA